VAGVQNTMGAEVVMQPRERVASTSLILVVDDDAVVRAQACAIQRDAGYRVLEAATGRGAMMLFEANPDIALIFTDIVMPGLDGFVLADVTKFKRPGIKILYTTAHLNEVRDKLGVAHGAILRKPYHAAELVQMVKQALG
jgi:CheY-like chemotaxis protein